MSLDRELVAAALPFYEVQGELGRGAWGIVLAGRHRQLGRDVAIKQLPRAFGADPAVRARFVSEARLLASLDHTHIVPIYDFVEHEGLCLLVMERLTGGTVWSRFRSGAFTPQRSTAVVLATASALQYAHRRNVLHRDIKPENLMFSGEGVLKVTDFGLAKVIGGSATVATRAGDVLGTPAYMAPEQAQGGMLGPPTDIYALGTVLYELLAGRLPYPEDSNPLATLYRHVHEPPRPLRDVAPHIPARLADVTERALQNEPADRYVDADAFALDLASAAVDAWGPAWLGETGVVVVARSEILGAAIGASGGRKAETIVATAVPATEAPAEGDGAPADLVPVNLLRPDFVGPAPLIEQTERQEAQAESDGAPPPPPAQPPARKRRVPRWAWVAAALLVVVAVTATTLLVVNDDAEDGLAARSSAPPTTERPAEGTRLTPASAWRALRDAPTARQQLPAVALGGTIWLFGGMTAEGSTAKVEGYDPAIDTWKTGPNLPLPLHHQMASAYKGELVVMGGWVPDGPNLVARTSDKVFALRNGSWVELPPLLRPRAGGAATVVGDRLVVFGGQADGRLVPTTEVFDGARWVETEPLPTPRDHLAAASDGRYVYAVGGRALSADSNLGAFERYDPQSQRWTKLADLPTPRGGLGAAVVGTRTLVTSGGENPTSLFDTVEIYDLVDGTWSTGPPMRTPRHGHAVAALGSSVYTLAGALQAGHTASSAVADVLDFAPAAPGASPNSRASAWRALRDAPTARQQLPAAVLGSTIWLFGGMTPDGSTARVEGYDPAIDTWRTGPNLPLPLHHEMAATYNGELVVMGGWVPEGPNLVARTSDKVFALRNGSWVELPPLLRPRAGGAAAAVENRLVVFGGQADGRLVPTTEVFDGTRWVETEPLPTPRDHLAAASDGRYVYAVGGRALSADSNLGAFERYDVQTQRWTKLADLPTPRGGLGAAIVGTRTLVASGGETATSVIDTVEIYDLVDGTWSAGPPMRTPRHGHAVAALGSSVYTLAGALQAGHTASAPVTEVLDL